MEELKRCKYCGGEAALRQVSDPKIKDYDWAITIRCRNCFHETPIVKFCIGSFETARADLDKKIEEASRIWNEEMEV